MVRKTFSISLEHYDVVWPPQSIDQVWFEGTIIIDANWDLWICTSVGNPGAWKKLSGGGSSANFYAEDLTSQVDGQTTTFNTNAGTPRQAGTIRVYLNGIDEGTPGSIQSGAVVEEVSPTQFKLAVVPEPPDTLHVTYFG